MVDGKLRIEAGIERALFASRWLMAPIYLGLMLSLLMLVAVFLSELAYYLPRMLELESEEAILAVLTLIDLSLAGNLLLIVLFSGYETFVSRIDVGAAHERPDWMGTVDFSGLKLKLVASIVAISAIHLLKWFMEIGEHRTGGADIDTTQLRWLVIIHLTFVASGVLLALMDWLAARSDRH
jgi:uncharacterized protein (TIGR00645 family)